MDIHVDEPGGKKLQFGEAYLLLRLSSRGRQDIRIVELDVPTGLQPEPELGVEDQQQLGSVGIEDERARREVSGSKVIARKAVVTFAEQFEHSDAKALFGSITGVVFAKEFVQVVAPTHRGHWTTDHGLAVG
jgi:hypothetical protein